jgi:hypothetical protein
MATRVVFAAAGFGADTGVSCACPCSVDPVSRSRGSHSSACISSHSLAARKQYEEKVGDMAYLVELPVGGTVGPPQIVGVEIAAADGLVKASRSGQVVARAAQSLSEMLTGIRPVAESFVAEFAGMTEVPDEIGLEFGLSLSADANLVVATTAAQANFKVTLTWHPAPVSAPAAGLAGQQP